MASTSLVASLVCSSSTSSSTRRPPASRSFPLLSKNNYRPALSKPLRSSFILRSSLQEQDQEKKETNRPNSSIVVAPDEQKEDEEKKEPSHHTGGGDPEDHEGGGDDVENKSREEQQEVDWRSDEEFKRFMGNPSIEAAIKLEKQRADRKLRELDLEPDTNPVAVHIFKTLQQEKQRLEEAKHIFKALDLNKVRSTLSLIECEALREDLIC